VSVVRERQLGRAGLADRGWAWLSTARTARLRREEPRPCEMGAARWE